MMDLLRCFLWLAMGVIFGIVAWPFVIIIFSLCLSSTIESLLNEFTKKHNYIFFQNIFIDRVGNFICGLYFPVISAILFMKASIAGEMPDITINLMKIENRWETPQFMSRIDKITEKAPPPAETRQDVAQQYPPESPICRAF